MKALVKTPAALTGYIHGEILSVARSLFIEKGNTVKAIAKELDLPVKVLLTYVDRLNWRQQRFDYNAAQNSELEIGRDRFTRDHQLAVLRDHVLVADRLMKKIKAVLRDPMTCKPRELESLAKAAKQAADIAARAVRVSEFERRDEVRTNVNVLIQTGLQPIPVERIERGTPVGLVSRQDVPVLEAEGELIDTEDQNVGLGLADDEVKTDAIGLPNADAPLGST